MRVSGLGVGAGAGGTLSHSHHPHPPHPAGIFRNLPSATASGNCADGSSQFTAMVAHSDDDYARAVTEVFCFNGNSPVSLTRTYQGNATLAEVCTALALAPAHARGWWWWWWCVWGGGYRVCVCVWGIVVGAGGDRCVVRATAQRVCVCVASTATGLHEHTHVRTRSGPAQPWVYPGPAPAHLWALRPSQAMESAVMPRMLAPEHVRIVSVNIAFNSLTAGTFPASQFYPPSNCTC